MQPAAATAFQHRTGGREQPDGALRVVLQAGHRCHAFEVVGGAGFVSGLGRQGQPFLQVPGRARQVALRPAAGRQVVERDQDADPVLALAARGQGG